MAYKRIRYYKYHKELSIISYNNNDNYHSIGSPALIIYKNGILIDEGYYINGVMYNAPNKPSSIRYHLNGQIKELVFTNSTGYYADNKISYVKFDMDGNILTQQHIFENGKFRKDCFE